MSNNEALIIKFMHSSTPKTTSVPGTKSRAAANNQSQGGIAMPAVSLPNVIQLNPEENKKYKDKWEEGLKQRMTERHPPQTYLQNMLELTKDGEYEEGEKESHIAQAKALYLEALADIREKANEISLDLSISEYIQQIELLEGRFAHWVEVPEQSRQYETIRADGSNMFDNTTSDEGIGWASSVLLEKESKINFFTAGIGEEEQLRRVVVSYYLSGFLETGREIHVRAQIARKKGKGMFDETPVFGDIIIYRSPKGQIDVRVLDSNRTRENSSLPEDEYDQKIAGALQEDLKATYKLKKFEVEGDAIWSVHDLKKLRMALGRLPEADQEAIHGVAFVRVKELSKDDTGRTLGAFKSGVQLRQIRLGDGTFDADAVAFIGSGLRSNPVFLSSQTILHEVGHAVADKKRLDAKDEVVALDARLRGLEEQKRATPRPVIPSDSLFGDKEDVDSDIKELLDSGFTYQLKKMEALRQVLLTASVEADFKAFDDDTKDKIFIDALKEMVTAFNKMLTTGTEEAHKAYREKAKIAKAAGEGLMEEDRFKEVIAAISAYRSGGAIDIIEKVNEKKQKQESEAYKAQLEKQAREEEEYQVKKKNYDRVIRSVESQIVSIEEQLREAKKALEKYSYPQKAGYSSRVKKFVAFVERAHIPPKITDYAGHSWNLDNPEEFFAEAYSIWLNDPVFLQKNYLPIYVWFQEGKYRD
jgi:hypothetical protein